MAEHVAAGEEADAATHSCLLAKGWDIEPIEDGMSGLSFDLSSFADHVADNLIADVELCQESLGIEIRYYLSRPELERMYGYFVDIYECLVAHGVEMSKSPPSRSSWVETFQAFQHAQTAGGNASIWHPYGDPGMYELSWDEFLEATNNCPQPFMS
ncbi:MAG: hypothetical protein FWD83_05130 [Promicromonosporaceae bacterium]|nr:hypothetical protein [Promicromonosporaceae bacterium]